MVWNMQLGLPPYYITKPDSPGFSNYEVVCNIAIFLLKHDKVRISQNTWCSCIHYQIMDRRSYPVLYSLVFGEGILNDAVAVALLGAVAQLDNSSKANQTIYPACSPAAAAVVSPGSPILVSSPGIGTDLAQTAATNFAELGYVGRNMLWSKVAKGSGGGGEDAADLGMWVELLGSFVWLGGGSMALGVAVGLLSALIMRQVFKKHHDGDREVRKGQNLSTMGKDRRRRQCMCVYCNHSDQGSKPYALAA
jgi:hypothetical protein